MRVGLFPENIIEAAASVLGLVPRPVFDTLFVTGLCQTLMVASETGVFEALAAGPGTVAEVAERCDVHPRAVGELLIALESSGYVRSAKKGRYRLARVAKKYLTKSSPASLNDHMAFMRLVTSWAGYYRQYLRTGEALKVHEVLSEEEWDLYQRGMRALAGLVAKEVRLRTPVPRGAKDMLDIGGSHGLFSCELCRKHPGLRSTVLDLPEACRAAAPILARECMGDRVRHKPGNALSEDLGKERYDLVFVANLVHHFDEPTNRELCRRVEAALKPGGVMVIQEILRVDSEGGGGQAGALANFFFSSMSASGLWSFGEMAAWQREAGLTPKKGIRFVTLNSVGQQAAAKRRI